MQRAKRSRRVRKAELRTLEDMSPLERISWAAERYGPRLVMSSSFGAQSAVLLHMVNTIAPGIPVIFVDTGYLFPETYTFVEELTRRLGLNVHYVQPQMTAARQEALFGKQWMQGVEGLRRYGRINKVEPMSRALKQLKARAWLSGIRRQQAKTRGDRPVAERQNRVMKIYPIIDWDNRSVHHYLDQHDLPYHPLWHKGYPSIGDWHSTRPLTPGMLEEETRFGGKQRECGLHIESGDASLLI